MNNITIFVKGLAPGDEVLWDKNLSNPVSI